MAQNLFKNLITYIFSNDAEKMAENKPLKYIAANNGMFEVRNNQLMEVSRKIDSIPKVPTLKEGIVLHIPKIPFEVFNIMVSFLAYVYEKDGTEGTIMLFYNENKKQFIPWVPIQENASASSDYKRDEDPEYTKMTKENILVMVAHSHPWGSGGISDSSPTPSGTDNKDEKETILYMIVGNVKGVPTTTVSTCPNGVRIKLNFFDVFSNPLVDGLPVTESTKTLESLVSSYVPINQIFPSYCNSKIELPESWYKRCTKRTYVAQRFNGVYSKGPGSAEDPAVQYRVHNMDYEDYSNYDDYYAYGNYYNGKRKASYYDEMEDMNEEEIMKYDQKLLNAAGVVDDDDDDIAHYELVDVMDACLDFTDVELAQLIFSLINEGKGSLLNQCLKAKEEVKKPSGSKAGDPSGLKLIAHKSKKRGKK